MTGALRMSFKNQNRERYKNQLFILVEIENYVYVVPAVRSESGEEFFPENSLSKPQIYASLSGGTG